jgi:hypothetical protein
MAAKAGTRLAVKAGTASTGIGAVVTGGMMVVDAAPEAWAVTKETFAVPGQVFRDVRAAKGLGGKLKAAASRSGKAFVDLNLAPARVGAAAIFGSGTVKMAREAAGETMAARKAARQNGVGTKAVEILGRAAKHAPTITSHTGTILREGGKMVGLAATTLIGGAVALKTAKATLKDAKNPSSVDANVAEINKLLKTMPSDWTAQLASSRAKLSAAGADSSQLPPQRPNAHDVLLALNLNNRGEVSSEAAAGQEPTSGNAVPEDVREAAMEGIRLSHKHNYGGYDFIGVARAIQLAISPKISDAALNRMRMYFDRKTKQDRLSDQYANKNGKRYWSWMNWGGDPGARWSHSKRFAQLVKENPMSAYSRRNPYFVTTGGQAVPRAGGEERSTWQAAASHAERQEGEGTLYRIGERNAMGHWPILDRRTGKDTGKYGMTKEGAQEVLKRLIRRTNPAVSTLIGDGYGVRMRDLVREGQGAELPKSTKAKKAQGAQARGKKAKSKRNPSPGFTTEEWLADVEGEEWANYDLNRAGIMHYSGSGIPTYRSIVRE